MVTRVRQRPLARQDAAPSVAALRKADGAYVTFQIVFLQRNSIQNQDLFITPLVI
jgi:hypothetical protein